MIYIIRHGETDWNKQKIIQGSTNDIPLNSDGLEQAKKLASYFSNKKIELIISSPLKRAAQTSAEIANKNKVKVIYDKNFIEINYGNWSGKKSDKIPMLFPDEWKKFTEDPESFAFKNGESIKSLYHRVVSGFKKLNPGITTLIVTHTNPIRMIAAYVLNMSIFNAYKLHFENCGISTFVYKHNRWEVDSLNCKAI